MVSDRGVDLYLSVASSLTTFIADKCFIILAGLCFSCDATIPLPLSKSVLTDQ